MKVIRIAAAPTLTPQEQAGIQQACAYLKANFPGIGVLLQNPSNLTFLMRLLEAISTNPNAVSILKNTLVRVQNAMQRDPTSAVAMLTKT